MATMGASISMAQASGKVTATNAQQGARDSAAAASNISRGSVAATAQKFSAALSIPIAIAIIAVFYMDMAYGSSD